MSATASLFAPQVAGAALPAPSPTPTGKGADAGGFAEALTKAATAVVGPQQQATKALDAFAKGADGEIHQTLMAVDRADVTLKFFVSVRNRALEAYREIMHMGG